MGRRWGPGQERWWPSGKPGLSPPRRPLFGRVGLSPATFHPQRNPAAGQRGSDLRAGRLENPFLVLPEGTWEVAAGGRGCRNLGAASKVSGSAAGRVPAEPGGALPGKAAVLATAAGPVLAPGCVCSSVLGRSGQEAPGQPLVWPRGRRGRGKAPLGVRVRAGKSPCAPEGPCKCPPRCSSSFPQAISIQLLLVR